MEWQEQKRQRPFENRDPQAEIMIFTQDHYPFYSRPRLPELLAKEVTVEEIFVYKREWYNKNKIQLYLNSTVKASIQKPKDYPHR